MSESASVDYDMIPLDLRNRSVGRRGRRGASPPASSPPPSRRPKTKDDKKPKAASEEKMVLDGKMLLLLLLGVLAIYFFLFFLLVKPGGAGGETTVDVTRVELMTLLEKQQSELNGFLKDAESKHAGEAKRLRDSLPDHISPLVKQNLEAATASLKQALSSEQKSLADKLAEQQRSDIARLKEEVAASIAPLVQKEVKTVEESLRVNVDLQVKSIEQRIVASLPAAGGEQLDLRKKDYALDIISDGTSSTYKDFSAAAKVALKITGVTMKLPPGPEITLEPIVENRCWAFAGSKGQITIRLREKTRVGSVTLFSTKETLSFFARNAPKEFQVFGIAANGKESLLGKATFNASGPERQTFALTSSSESVAVSVRFLSNHGDKDFTCVQKIAVHSE